MRRVRLLALLFAAGCTGEPDDLFFWYGTALDTQDAPVSNRRISVRRTKHGGCWPGTPHPELEPYESFSSFATNDSGEFLIELMRYQLELPRGDWGGGSRCFELVIPGDSPGVWTSMEVVGVAQDQDLSSVLLWEDFVPSINSDSAGYAVVPVSELPRAEKNPPGTPFPPGAFVHSADYDQFYYRWQVDTDTGPMWIQNFSDGLVLRVVPEMLEGSARARVSLGAVGDRLPATDGIGGTAGSTAIIKIHGRTFPLEPLGVVPVSRGASCVIRRRQLSPCPATDGSYALFNPEVVAPRQFSRDDEGVFFAMRLSRPAVARALVLRDVFAFGGYPDSTIKVEGSADGVSWRKLGTFEAEEKRSGAEWGEADTVGLYKLISLDTSGGAIEHLRFTCPGNDLFGLREISVLE
jgi:hypothetical protein